MRVTAPDPVGVDKGMRGSLWRIEHSFRILKSDLCARPVFVKKTDLFDIEHRVSLLPLRFSEIVRQCAAKVRFNNFAVSHWKNAIPFIMVSVILF